MILLSELARVKILVLHTFALIGFAEDKSYPPELDISSRGKRGSTWANRPWRSRPIVPARSWAETGPYRLGYYPSNNVPVYTGYQPYRIPIEL